MGVSKRVNSEHKTEIRELKEKIKRMDGWKELFPGQLTGARRLDISIRMNEMYERIDHLRRNKTGSSEHEFTYVLKMDKVKHRSPKTV